MSMQGHLEEREARQAGQAADRARDLAQGDVRAWLMREKPPEVRLAAFDRWVLAELDRRLDWGWAGAHKVQRLHQCRVQLDGVMLELFRRGWMLDGKRLADRITGMLDAIGQAQRAGKVRDFWPYFKAAVSRYVGANAEEIQVEAMHAGAAVGTLFQALLARAPAVRSMPELVAQRTEETLREKVNREKAKTRRTSPADQLPLL